MILITNITEGSHSIALPLIYTLILSAKINNSCKMCTSGLPDMCTLSPRALCRHIRQTTHEHVTTIFIPKTLYIMN